MTKQKIKQLEKRLLRLEQQNELQIRLSLILEQQVEINKKQSTAIENISNSINSLSTKHDLLEKETLGIKTDLKQLIDIDSISFVEFVKKYLSAALLGVVSAIVGGFMIWLGFK